MADQLKITERAYADTAGTEVMDIVSVYFVVSNQRAVRA